MKRAEGCTICGRVQWGEIVLLRTTADGLRTWRHDSCAIGSEAWAIYFRGLPTVEQSKLADFYRLYIGVSVHYTPFI